MKIRNLYILLVGLLSLVVVSCEDNPNDWGYDESYDRLFRPTEYEAIEQRPTSVVMRFFGVSDATRYVFEFSEGDSLEFTNITKTIEILVDTLIPYDEGESIVTTEYRVSFGSLKGTTSYSVRMKAVSDTKNMESGYSQVYFVTSDEQIIKSITPSVTKATVAWETGADVTHVIYWKSVDEGDSDRQTMQLTAEQKAEGRAIIRNLSFGSYIVQIYNNDAKRGESSFTTLGSPGDNGIIFKILSADAGKMNENLEYAVSGGYKKVSVICMESDKSYEVETITIPAGIEELYFFGESGDDGTLPEMYLHKVVLSAPMESISFQGIDLNARLNSSNYVFSLGDVNYFKTIEFDGCKIRNIGRCLIRFNHAELNIESVRINNSIVENVGVSGYGFYNFGTDVTNVGLISITNSTIMEFGSDRLMHIKGGVKSIVVDKCILYNNTSKSVEIFRFDKEPGSVAVTNSIFAGSNGGNKINSGNAAYTYLEFYGCYLTSDFEVKDHVFTNATLLDITSGELFVGSKNGDFRLKEGVRFAGEGKAGDPRWW